VAAILTPAVDDFYKKKEEGIMKGVQEKLQPLQNEVKEFINMSS
jgi:hypothetical protein